MAGPVTSAFHGAIARPALTARLVRALDEGAVMLVAPAGSGKTIALDSALEARGGAVARVRCTAADGDAGRLVDHVVAVLRRVAPGTADAIGDRLALAFGPVDPEAVARELADDLARLVLDPLTVVLDDAEHVAANPTACALPEALFAVENPHLRVAVASRRRLPVPLARLRASGRLTELGAADLAFSAQECAEVLRRRAPAAAIPDAVVGDLMAATEGWPLGVGLAARHPDAGGSRGPSTPRELAAFVEEEVLDALDPAQRAATLASSLPTELDVATLAALGHGADVLERLLDADLFLRSTGREGRWAYHPLVREVLLGRLRAELEPAALAQLHGRLAEHLAETHPLDAVEHWFAAGDEARALRTLGRHSQPLVRSSPAVVREWLGRLGPETAGEPAVALLHGQLGMGEGRHAEVVEDLRRAAEEWERRGSGTMWTARFALAQALIVTGRFGEVPALAEGFDAEGTAHRVGAPMVALWAGIAIGGTGRREDGRALLDRALRHPLGALIEPISIAYDAFYVAWHAGRLDDAWAGAQEAIARMEDNDPVRWLTYTLWYAAYVAEARGEEDAAIALLERARDVASAAGIGLYPGAVAGAMKAGFDARAGRLGEADVELARVAPILARSWHGYDVHLARAELHARRGDRREAAAAADRALALVEGGYVGERLRAVTHLVPLFARIGRAGRAREVADGAIALFDEGTSAPRLLALRAWLRDEEGDPEALDDLCAAWVEAGDQAHHLVRGEWPRIEGLVQRAVTEGRLDAAGVVAVVEAALPDGDALLPFAGNPAASARQAVAAGLGRSGHPEAPRVLEDLATDGDPAVAATAARSARRLREDPPALSFGLFGGFSVHRGGRLVDEGAWQRRVAERLIRYLLVHRGGLVPEEELFEAFWPDKEVTAARRGLQVAVSCARAVLDPPGVTDSVVELRERAYRLALADGDSVDTETFERVARSARAAARDGPGAPEVLRSAIALWGGEPLPQERYEGWAAAWRMRLADLHLGLLTDLTQANLAAGDPFAAATAARQLVELDGVGEGGHRLLMTALARSGRRGEALRQFLDCRRALVEDLGVEPSEETAELQRAILAGDPV